MLTFYLCSGSEDYLSPLLEARDFLQRLAVEELAVASSAEKVRYPLRGPLLARMELLRQLFHNKMHRIPLELGKGGKVLEECLRVCVCV